MRVAIIGCGQLARMMAQAGSSIDLNFVFVARGAEDTRCVDGLGDIVRFENDMPVETLASAIGHADVVTVESEQVSLELLENLSAFYPVYPNAQAIKSTQHRLLEKALLTSLGLPTAPHRIVEDTQGLKSAIDELGPVIVKHPAMGYDGKHQWSFNASEDVENDPKNQEQIIWDTPYLVEKKINFLYEASLIGVRSVTDDVAFYPMAKNHHHDGILLSSLVLEDCEVGQHFAAAKDYMTKLFDKLDYHGVLTIELFVTDDGLYINELAPRVHNSGHWTMDGSVTSQFESHVRAITGMPLGDTAAKANAAMVNLLGVDSLPFNVNAHCAVHWYNKEVKPKRKMGHINIFHEDKNTVCQLQEKFVDQLYFQD